MWVVWGASPGRRAAVVGLMRLETCRSTRPRVDFNACCHQAMQQAIGYNDTYDTVWRCVGGGVGCEARAGEHCADIVAGSQRSGRVLRAR